MTVPDDAAIARVCHEANRALQVVQADPAIPVAPPWEECPQEMRDSSAEGVRCTLAGATPGELHESWCEFKRSRGWVHGPVKDEAAKTHPCLVPYGELPDSWKLKDRLFTAIVAALGGAREGA